MKEIELGKYLRSLRKKEGLTLVELSKMSGVSNPYISQIENGKFTPSPEILKKLANPLGVTAFDLMVAAGHWTADETTWRKEIFEESKKNLDDINNFLEVNKASMSMMEKDFYHLLRMNEDLYYGGKKLNNDEVEKVKTILAALFE